VNQGNSAVLSVRVRLVAIATLVAALIAPAAVPAFAAAESYVVNLKSVGPGCSPGNCTLPGAIEAANTNPGHDTIEFAGGGVFGGAAPQSTIPLSTGLPAITEEVSILGGHCPTGSFVEGPCVELTLNATASTGIFTVEASNVLIEGLALEGAGYGILVKQGAQEFAAFDDWFGAGLNSGTGTANATAGILLERGADFATIGGEEEAERNVFQQGAIGAYLDGASSATITGNWFGLRPDGTFALGHSLTTGVRIANDTHVPTAKAADNKIGGVLGKAEAESPECDGLCNVFATEMGGTGVDLGGVAGQSNEAATGPTGIRGNYFGLSPAGTASIGSQDLGVDAGPSGPSGPGPQEVEIGGEDSSTEGNYFVKAAARGIEAEEAPDLTVIGNHLGYLFDGTADDPADIHVSSTGLAKGASIYSNSIEAGNGVGIESFGAGSEIGANKISGGFIGIVVEGADGGVGSLIEGNELTDPALFGVYVENSGNLLIGNRVTGSEVGLKVEGEDFEHQVESNVLIGNTVTNANHVGIEVGSNANHTRVGGDGPGEANTISGVGHLVEEEGDGAITILSRTTGRTEVAANLGSDNALKFITLISHGGPEEPNGGIQPPALASVLQSSASGTAKPGATVRLFVKSSSAPGELGARLATVVADAGGSWSATYATMPVGTLVTATQTSDGGTSELTAPVGAAADPVPPPSNTGTPGSSSPAPTTPVTPKAVAPTKPKVKITKGPKKSSETTRATFKFKAEPAAGASFECKLDGAKWAKCSSPKTFKGLKPGKHTFRVRAKAKGLTGPATVFKFTIKT
jgi:parallel beta-helix repeat protein